ncbi:hypothetical protein [Pseudodesulfovibrio senegalensis]|uniref:VirB4 family type IV secretion/conjugal transfer ATPase n=1 Tax=Pseudodesulfovibrio senegalensis TaxID=1721087 RepID=UPI0013763D34|nr:hypothetical protein [Pseudodesulfovibrio senegalensis]
MTITNEGKHAYVIEFYGKDYSGLSQEHMLGLFQGRKSFWDNIPTGLLAFSHSHHIKQEISLPEESFSHPVATEIARRHYQNFKETYRTKHYLLLTNSNKATFMDELLEKGKKTFNKKSTVQSEEDLFHFVEKTLTALGPEYGAKLLLGDELTSYWSWLLSGYPVYQMAPPNGDLTGILGRSALLFGRNADYQIYKTNHGDLYSAWFRVMIPAKLSNEDVLNALFQVPETFSLLQTLSRMEKYVAKNKVDSAKRHNVSFRKDADEYQLELESLAQRLTSDQVQQFTHRLSLEVFGSSQDDLNRAIRNILTALENYGYSMARDITNIEGQFWGMKFPGMENQNPVMTPGLTSENAAHFISFASVGEGHNSCSFGPSPVAHMRTISGTEFSFIFQENPDYLTNGNTLCIGGTGSGKTTLVQFLGTMLRRFPNWRTYAFDRLNGMEVWTHCLDGQYLTSEDIQSIHCAPFMQPLRLNQSNRDFVENMASMLIGGDITDEMKVGIGQTIQEMLTIDRKDRTLDEFYTALKGFDQDAARKMKRWTSQGDKAAYFSGSKNSINALQKHLTFDMTGLLDSPDVLGPYVYNFVHEIMTKADGKSPYGIIIDELPNYLENSTFAAEIERFLQEIRKTHGILIAMCQSADTVLRHKSANKFLSNIATYILFPEPHAEWEDYKRIGLNETEFDWIKGEDPLGRKVLVKRHNGESVFLDVDLSGLGPYLRCFDSARETVRTVRQLRNVHNENWLRHYLFA